MAATRADVVVVGAGLFGTSVAFQLARRGAGEIVLVERDAPGAGDSGLSFSMVRRHYSNEVTARLAMRGVDVIRRWDEEVGTADSGYVRTGYLLIADAARVEAVRENVERLRAWGLDTTFVSPAEILALEPQLAPEGIAGGAYEPDGGFADAQKMTLAWFAACVRLGVRVELGCRVRRLLVRDGRVTGVETDAGAIAASVVVNAAGAWGPELARTVGVDVPVSLRRLQVAFVLQPADRAQARFTFSSMVTNLVFRPDRAGLAGVVAYQPEEPLRSRDECRRELDPGYEKAIRTALRERLPAYVDAEWAGGFAGAYDYTPDWNPLLGWAPGTEGLYLALGWSGHGFKLAPAVGEVVADEILGRPPAIDVRPLAPGRFERGEELRLAYGPGARA
ncbi:MAG: FAD-binding oxidoreductase [Actinomycetota bacterium]|nr:FAD-binding oxidoreductase [Actinomycetota bacterium]